MPLAGNAPGIGAQSVWWFALLIATGCAAGRIDQKAGAGGAAPGPEEAAPRVVRVVCTDHICGHCDGRCHPRSGHVAVDRKGHCACTPDEGGALDRATRRAYAEDPPR